MPPASLRRGIQREKRKRHVGDMALSGLRAQVARWGATPPQQRGYCSLDFENTVHVAEFRKIPDAGGVLRDNRVLEHEGQDAHRSGGPSSMPNTLVKRTAEAVGYGKMGTSFRSTRPGAAVSYCHRGVVWWLPSFCRSSPACAAVQLGGA